MSNETPQRRPGPHAPLPVAAAVQAAMQSEQPAPSAPVTVREEDSRARAARRALELRDHLGGMSEEVDQFYIPPHIIPDGWSYEWKRHTVLGKEDPTYQVRTAHRGWEPVPRSRHPEMMPENFPGNTILREGQILMERPKEITDEAKAADYRKAVGQVRGKEEQLGATPPGTLARDADPRVRPSVKKAYESIPIPKE